MRRCLAACLLLCAIAAPAAAQERISHYDSVVSVNRDGSLDVTERITVHAEGSQVRRGIYRDYPTRYRDRHGNRVMVGFEVREVLRNGAPEPFFTENVDNGVRVNTGNDDLLPVPADYVYTLRYRTTRQLGFFVDHDELYWNAIGTGWAFPIEAGTVVVQLPQAVPVARLRAEGYTGPQGAQGQDYVARVAATGQANWRLTRALSPGEGMTVVLSFPRGIVTEPSRAQKIRWLLHDNRGVLVALAGLAVLLAFCISRWRAVGRDPRAGVVIARYDPPEGYSPASLRFVQRMGHDTRCFSSDLLALAVAGCLRIEREKHLLRDSWKLVGIPGAQASVSASQRPLLALVSGGNGEIELKNSNAATLQAAVQAQIAALKRAYDGRMFRRNGSSMAIAIAITAAVFALSMLVSGGGGLLYIVAIGLMMMAIVIVFARLVRAPTPEGRKLLDQIAGLKLYLGVAERDELARMPEPGTGAPALDADRYQLLLPYAVALDVEDAWTAKFTLAVGAAAAAAAAAGISWYRGGGIDSLGSLTDSIGSSLSSQIASSSTPPGSSSGGGGGGSSGGGGGGGGGGGR